jgi:hypothetical protein
MNLRTGNSHPAIALAKEDAVRLGIPAEGYQAYRAQYHSAIRRGIDFDFTMEEWWTWWQTDGRWQQRGVAGLVMARLADTGSYCAANVKCISQSENSAERDHETMSIAIKEAMAARKKASDYRHHLAVRGRGHPRSRAVNTPKGPFGSIALAAEAFEVTRQAAFYRVRDRWDGWSYVDAVTH